MRKYSQNLLERDDNAQLFKKYVIVNSKKKINFLDVFSCVKETVD